LGAGPVDWPVACFVQFAGSEQPGEQAALSTAKVKEACVGREQAAFQDFTEDVVGRQFAACIAIGEPVAILERAGGFVEQGFGETLGHEVASCSVTGVS
jgi:hypothetical protein